MGHLDLLFKVTELFIEFALLTGYLKKELNIDPSFLQCDTYAVIHIAIYLVQVGKDGSP